MTIEDSRACFFNTSLEKSQFLDPWKIARVSPSIKDGDKTEKFNYRPISVLPVVSRLFEKLVFHLYLYLNDNCFIKSNQSGFRELHSTVNCLLKNTDDWYNGMDTGNLVGMVFVDLKKLSILLIIKFSVGSWHLMVFCIGNWPGFGSICLIASSTAE